MNDSTSNFGVFVNIQVERIFSAVRSFAVLAVLATVVGHAAPAQANGPMGRQFGLGLALGNPTSFTGKYHLGNKQALDFHIGAYHVYGHGRFDDSLFLGGDYLFEIWNFVENGTVSVPFYAGPGGGLIFDADDDDCHRHGGNYHCHDDYDFGFGPRMPIGIGVEFQKAPFELFLELTPTLMFVFDDDPHDDDDFDLDWDIPNFAFIGRFYF